MKSTLLTFTISLTIGAASLNAQNVNIPDANFKSCLLSPFFNIDLNNDGEIQLSEAIAYSGQIDCNGSNINNVTGIEEFINVTQISLSSNNLTNINVSFNTLITQINVSDNQLTALDLSNNPAITNLNCQDNQIANLDLSNNTSLTQIYCFNNQLTQLNVRNGNNTNLLAFQAYNNQNLNCIEVDDLTYSSTNWISGLFQFDSQANFSEDCSLTTSVLEINEVNLFSIYPNPAKDVIYFSSHTNVQLLSASGQKITDEYNVSLLDLSSQSAGIYFLIITDNTGQLLQRCKIVKK